MKKDQYILAITGILDRESAVLLLREVGTLVRTGYHRILLDARALGPVLPEGVLELRRGLLDLVDDLPAGSQGPPELWIECVDLGEHASAQLLLHGVPVDNRRAVLASATANFEADASPSLQPAAAPVEPDAGAAAARLGVDGWLVDCLNCRHASRVRAAGEYACPVCGSAFRMSPAGEVVTV
ncbi:MAG: hypothetical protein RIF32_15325 [Leptospirales bacterium]|jgi:hypothetical protein